VLVKQVLEMRRLVVEVVVVGVRIPRLVFWVVLSGAYEGHGCDRRVVVTPVALKKKKKPK
jgi:hypothetical protein